VLGGALGAAAFVAWQVQGRLPAPAGTSAFRPAAFRPWQFRTLERACQVFLDDREAGTTTAQVLDGYFAGSGAEQAADLALALGVLEFLPAGALSPRRFSRLSFEDASTVLARWERSSLGVRRQIAKALRDAARFTWFAREETWADMGYDGTWIGRAGSGG